jgi:hypothetical protein
MFTASDSSILGKDFLGARFVAHAIVAAGSHEERTDDWQIK